MDSATKAALDGLEAAHSERTKGTWSAIATIEERRTAGRRIVLASTPAWEICTDATERARQSRDAKAIALSVNLSAPLAAVVRAVADRPWWDRSSEVDEDGEDCADKLTCLVCGEDHWDGDILTHADLCEMAEIDAALDAFDASAAAQGFGKETT